MNEEEKRGRGRPRKDNDEVSHGAVSEVVIEAPIIPLKPVKNKIKVLTFDDVLQKVVEKGIQEDLAANVFKTAYEENNVITHFERKGRIYFICREE